MIEVTKMVDKSVLDKVDIDLIQEYLPQVDRNIFITYCATRQERKEDIWEKDGILYLSIVLDFQKVLISSEEEVLEMMMNYTTKALDGLKPS